MIRQGLAGRSIALVGLGRAEMLEVTEALERFEAAWQAFSRADVAAVAAADLVIAGCSAAASLGETTRPMLVVGPLSEIVNLPIDGVLSRDFIVAPPLDGEEIVLRASHLLALSKGQPKRPVTAEMPVIVAADDDPTTTAIVRTVVSQYGMTCHVAADGRTALELVRRVNPAAVVLDVNMPFLDGFEVLAALRNDPQTAAIAVVMLTSVQQEADVVRAFSLGADDYIVKPFNPMELLARLKRLVKKQA